MTAALGTADRKRIDELADALGTLRLGAPSAIGDVVPALQQQLEVDSVVVYSVAERNEGFEIARWHAVGAARQVRTHLGRWIASKPLQYDFRDPEPMARNRVIDANAWIDRHEPGTWERAQFRHEVFGPAGIFNVQQTRALLCDGNELLAWFGSLHDGPIFDRHFQTLTALVEPMRRRLLTERRLEGVPRISGALATVLERLAEPAFVLDKLGRIAEMNSAAGRIYAADPSSIREGLTAAIHGRASAWHFELSPFSESGEHAGWLAILRLTDRLHHIEAKADGKASQWTLTRRQRQVLLLVVRGLDNATIAAELGVGLRTVEHHVSAVFDRAGVSSRAALTASVLGD